MTGRSSGGNQVTYLNQAKRILRGCDIAPGDLETLATSRVDWRKRYKDGIALAEATRIDDLKAKRARRKRNAGMDLGQRPP